MPSLSPAEKVELAAIPVVATLTAWFAPRPSLRLELGEFIAGAALLVLVQGFFRDLWLLRQARRQTNTTPPAEAACMCVESVLGLTGIVAGVAFVGLGFDRPVALSPGALTALVATTMIAGYLLKDFVFGWSPWRIRREKNHAQLIVRWRR